MGTTPGAQRRVMAVDVTVLAMAGCPNAPLLEQRLAEAVAGRPGIAVRRIEITSPAAAARHGMHGSPTLLIDGADPFAPPGAQPVLACRLFRDDDGRPVRAPSVAALRRALARASGLTGSVPAARASAAPHRPLARWRRGRVLAFRAAALAAAGALIAGCTATASPPPAGPARAPGPARASVITLTRMSTLRSLFNREQGHPRLVLIFSPT